VKILESSERGLYVGEIQDILKIPQSTVSGELKILKSVNLIFSKRKGKYIHYYLRKSVFKKIQQSLYEIINDVENGF